MTQKERLLFMFHENNNRLTLRQIMQTTLGCEYRARFTDLRHDGVNIVFTRGKTPSDNLYTLIPNKKSQNLTMKPFEELEGQLLMNLAV